MDPDEQITKSLRLSFYEGSFASAMVGLAQYLSPFILSIDATVKQVGILAAVPSLLASVVQLRSASLTDYFGSRKKMIIFFTVLQACMLIPMAYIAFSKTRDIYLFIACTTLFTVFGNIILPPFGSLMSDLVHEKKRGAFFGSRNMLLGIVTFITVTAAGIFMDVMQTRDVAIGFAVIFAVAFFCRMGSLHFLKRIYEPPLRQEKEVTSMSFIKFLSGIKENNFAKFVFASAMMTFSVHIAAPYFSVLMLKELHFSYFIFTVVTTVGSVSIFTNKRWGVHADYFGNIRIIKLTAVLISILPLLWLVNRSPVFIGLVQMFSGIVWAGFMLCSGNFIYDAIPSEGRAKSIGYFNAINGVALFAGAMLGGYFARTLPPLMGSKILSVLLLSSILRMSVTFFLFQRLSEVRQVRELDGFKLFSSVMGLRTCPELQKRADCRR